MTKFCQLHCKCFVLNNSFIDNLFEHFTLHCILFYTLVYILGSKFIYYTERLSKGIDHLSEQKLYNELFAKCRRCHMSYMSSLVTLKLVRTTWFTFQKNVKSFVRDWGNFYSLFSQVISNTTAARQHYKSPGGKVPIYKMASNKDITVSPDVTSSEPFESVAEALHLQQSVIGRVKNFFKKKSRYMYMLNVLVNFNVFKNYNSVTG